MAIYPNLRAEIARCGLKNGELCAAASMKLSTFSGKINGQTDFTLGEAVRIKECLKTDLPLEVLFAKG